MKRSTIISVSKILPIFVATAAIVGLSNLESKAQVWSGSPVNTFTTGNTGIGIGIPATNAQLEVENVVYPSGPPPGPFFPVTDIPGTKISRKSYRNPGSSPATPSNIFEIYEQWFDYVGGGPLTNNNPRFIVTESGYCAINKLVPHARLDVGGNIMAEAEISAGTDVNAAQDVNAARNLNAVNRLYIGDDANIGHRLYVSGQSYFTGSVTMGASNRIADTLYLEALASGSNKLAIINNVGAVTAQNLPTIGISGSTITLTNGGSISSSISLPPAPAGDNLGNHIAVSNLDMNNKNIDGANVINSKNTITRGLDLMYDATHLSGRFIPVISGAFEYMTKFEGYMGINRAPTSSYDLACNGNIIAAAFHTVSDKNFKKNISTLGQIKDKVLQLGTYQYNYNQNATKDFKFDDKLHFGFIAQEVQAIFPSLTNVIDTNGHLSVNYIEIIPLLLQTIKEEDAIVKGQGEQIELLKKEIELLKNKSTTSVENENTVVSSTSKLAQNVPNPFGRETQIGFEINENFNQAFIGIYNLNGQQIRKLQIQKGQSEITLNADQMEPGMYVYSLVVNNNLIDSKRMVITK
jgi:hypothetical protein